MTTLCPVFWISRCNRAQSCWHSPSVRHWIGSEEYWTTLSGTGDEPQPDSATAAKPAATHKLAFKFIFFSREARFEGGDRPVCTVAFFGHCFDAALFSQSRWSGNAACPPNCPKCP